jgi:hypothetical protein
MKGGQEGFKENILTIVRPSISEFAFRYQKPKNIIDEIKSEFILVKHGVPEENLRVFSVELLWPMSYLGFLFYRKDGAILKTLRTFGKGG